MYFLSDRNFRSLVGSPWGARQPEPYFDHKWKVYHIALDSAARSPFRAMDELYEAPEDDNPDSVSVVIHKVGLQQRIAEVPLAAGNYSNLKINKKGLFMVSRSTGLNASSDLIGVAFEEGKAESKEIVAGIRNFNISGNGERLVISKSNALYVVDAKISKADLSDSKVDLSDWKFPIDVREDWQQLYTDAWRMERDYFYDANMHGVDWDAMHERYLPLLERVTTRDELSDVIGRYVGELSALHTSVRGGDMRDGPEDIGIGELGAHLVRDEAAGGYRIDQIYQADPDYPNELSPLADPYLNISEGDVITHVDGESTLDVAHISSLLRNKAGEQVRLGLNSEGSNRDVIVTPISNTYNLRYRDWEYSRRKMVDRASDNEIGYVHLRAMGSNDISQWYREFYPVFDRPGLIIDVSHNRGGNIEAFILEKLLREAWMWWAPRSGEPYSNMHYAFNGHIVVLCNERTASDGELFAEGFRRLDLGTIIGTRTWGGEIWLGSANRLSDGGLARAPMTGVYDPKGEEWLIEGHGVDPDIVVENLPHETFNGADAQLDAAIEFLKKKMKEDPRGVPRPPAYPDKSFRN